MVVIILVLAGVLAGISVLIRDYFIDSKQQELTVKGQELSVTILDYYEGRIQEQELAEFLNRVDSLLEARVWVMEQSGRLVAMSIPQHHGTGMHGQGQGLHGNLTGNANGNMRGHMRGHMQGNDNDFATGMMNISPGMGQEKIGWMAKEVSPVFAGQTFNKVLEHPYYGETMLAVATPVRGADGVVKAAVLLNAPVTGVDEVLRRLWYYILLAGIGGAVAAVFVVDRLSGRIVRPLQKMQQAAVAMAQGKYDIKVQENTVDEVGQLGQALNSLALDLSGFVAKAEQTEKIRRDFVANVSHELRTPITIIRGYSEAMLDGTAAAADSQKYCQLIQQETVRLERLVKDLLDLSRLQSRELPLELEDIPLGEVVTGVVSMLSQKAKQKGLHFCLACEEHLPLLSGNGDRLTQLFLILLDNAVNYTPTGGKIQVNVQKSAGSSKQECILVSIADSGIGIPAEELPFIWERFYKVNKAHTRTSGEMGMGLGLSLAREIIDRHQANCTVVSTVGQGTEFKLEFPLTPAMKTVG